MIRAVKFVSIPVRDQDLAVSFYTEKLGFQIMTDQPFDDKQRWIELRIAGSETKVVLFIPPGNEEWAGTSSNVTFMTDDIDRTYRELQELGGGIHGSSHEAAMGTVCEISGCGWQSICPYNQVKCTLFSVSSKQYFAARKP